MYVPGAPSNGRPYGDCAVSARGSRVLSRARSSGETSDHRQAHVQVAADAMGPPKRASAASGSRSRRRRIASTRFRVLASQLPGERLVPRAHRLPHQIERSRHLLHRKRVDPEDRDLEGLGWLSSEAVRQRAKPYALTAAQSNRPCVFSAPGRREFRKLVLPGELPGRKSWSECLSKQGPRHRQRGSH